MSLLAKFTVKPLLITCAVLLAALAASGLYAYKLRSDVATAQAALTGAQGETKLAQGERDQAAQRASELATTASGWETVAGERGTLLAACQLEGQRQREAGDRAVARARAAAADAERTLDAFTARYQVESRRPDCERARHAMAAACPALEGF